MEYVTLEHSERVMIAHDSDTCIGPVCSLHNRSDHSMRSFPQNWREDRYLMERICPHGIGHPDPDDPRICMFDYSDGRNNYELAHGCDGCCEGAYDDLL